MNHTNDRIIILAIKEGMKAKDSRDQTDARLFTGDNKLHAKRDFSTSNLWYLEFDHGTLPPVLRYRYTKFSLVEKAVREYYDKKNVIIKEVIG